MGPKGDHGNCDRDVSNQLPDLRDRKELGHCNFQFYGNAAGRLFQPGGAAGLPKFFAKHRACTGLATRP
jgi:hypothetical protein